jgi:uncharacterized protein YgfB (UPF0149 family)
MNANMSIKTNKFNNNNWRESQVTADEIIDDILSAARVMYNYTMSSHNQPLHNIMEHMRKI